MGLEHINRRGKEASAEKPETRSTHGEIMPASNDKLFQAERNVSVYMERHDLSRTRRDSLFSRTPVGRAIQDGVDELHEAVFRGRLRANDAISDATQSGRTNYLRAAVDATMFGPRTPAYDIASLSPSNSLVPDVVRKLAKTRADTLGRVSRHILDHPEPDADVSRIRRQTLDALILAAGRQTQAVTISPHTTDQAGYGDFTYVGNLLERIQGNEPDAIGMDVVPYLRITALGLGSNGEKQSTSKPTLAERIPDITDALAGKIEAAVAIASILSKSRLSIVREFRTGFMTRLLDLRHAIARDKFIDAVRFGDLRAGKKPSDT